MNIRALRISLLLLLGALPPRVHAEWFILEWMEKPASRGSSTLANVGIFDHHCQVSVFEKSVRDLIESFHEEDFKACLPSPLAVCDDIPLFEVLLDGLPAMTDENGLRLLSSWSFRGPNVAEHLDPLRNHSWDVYRLNHWEQLDKTRFYEFIRLVRKRAEKWYGYDFAGIFGLWNSNLRPTTPPEIGHGYTCATVVVAALSYAGVELDAYQRYGMSSSES
jgi:hypothetical protein